MVCYALNFFVIDCYIFLDFILSPLSFNTNVKHAHHENPFLRYIQKLEPFSFLKLLTCFVPRTCLLLLDPKTKNHALCVNIATCSVVVESGSHGNSNFYLPFNYKKILRVRRHISCAGTWIGSTMSYPICYAV